VSPAAQTGQLESTDTLALEQGFSKVEESLQSKTRHGRIAAWDGKDGTEMEKEPESDSTHDVCVVAGLVGCADQCTVAIFEKAEAMVRPTPTTSSYRNIWISTVVTLS